MEKWLDKYDDGGYIQENYNDSSVSLPEGFVGMGNNTQGRNYSPAWGGQFQEGGNVYSSQFKTKPKLQHGGTSANISSIQTSVDDAEKFRNDWMQSPQYKSMLKTSGNTTTYPDLSVKYVRKHSNKNYTYDIKDIPNIKLDNDDYITNAQVSSGSGINQIMNINKNSINNSDLKYTLQHELSHITDSRGIGIPISDINKISQYAKPTSDFGKYVAIPSETRARLMSIREFSQDNNIYNPMKDKITKEQLDKIKYAGLDDLKTIYSDDQILDLLNSISKNDSPSVPKAQNGLWTTNKRGYVDSALNANKHLDWVKRLYDANPKAVMVPGEKYSSTHLMGDDNQGYVFPSIVNMNGQLVDLGDGAEDYARETNTGIQFPKEQGTWFARSTNDKSGYKMGTGVLKGTPVMQKYKSIDKKAMGGNIPGSVGFTYARTGAPSNGPHAKKTLASAQNGTIHKKKTPNQQTTTPPTTPAYVPAIDYSKLAQPPYRQGVDATYRPPSINVLDEQEKIDEYARSNVRKQELNKEQPQLKQSNKSIIKGINYGKKIDPYLNIIEKDPQSQANINKRKQLEFARNLAIGTLAPAAIVEGAAALPFIAPALTTDIAGISGLTAGNLLNAGFAYEGIKNLPNTGNSIKNAYNTPTWDNIGNAALQTGATALDIFPFLHGVSKGFPSVMEDVNQVVNSPTTKNILKTAYDIPRAESIKEAMGRIGGIPLNKDIPRMGAQDVKALRQVQEIGRLRATNVQYAEQMKYGLENNLPEEHFQKVFGKSREEAQNLLDTGFGQQVGESSGTINLRRPSRNSTARTINGFEEEQNIALEQMGLGADDIATQPYRSYSDMAIDRLNDLRGSDVDIVGGATDVNGNYISNSYRPDYENINIRSQRIQDILDDFSNQFNQLPPPPEYRTLTEPRRGRTLIPGMERPTISLPEQLKQDIISGTNNLENKAQNFLINKTQSYPYYSGKIQEKVPSLYLSRSGNLKNVSKTVNFAPEGIQSGDVFTGSTNTSHSSYLPQLKQVFKYDKGAPQFFGYKPMNTSGFLSGFDYSKEDIAKYLNSEIDEQIKRGIIPKNIQRPFLKENSLLLPHYGIKQYKQGGVIKDNNGYWNPDNWGKTVEIGSPDITMQGVNQPLIGISDKGDVKYMEPGKDYKFKGKKVKEYPVAQKGFFQSLREDYERGKATKDTQKYTDYFNSYINRPIFEGTKLKGEDLAVPFMDFVKQHPQINPEDLAKLMLTQGQTETHLGLYGRAGKPGENNPFNVREYDTGTKKVYHSPKEGIADYLNTLGSDYLPSANWNVKELINNYVNKKGSRYASASDYEQKLNDQYNYINRNYPIPKQKNGGSTSAQDRGQLKKLDQLTNFTNYNKPKAKNGGWLDKYQ